MKKLYDSYVIFKCSQEIKDMLAELAERRHLTLSQALRDMVVDQHAKDERADRREKSA